MASQAPEEAPVKSDQPHRAVDGHRRRSEAASPTAPLNNQRDGNAKEESPRVENNRKPLDQRTRRRRRVADQRGSKSNVPPVDHRKRQDSREAASPAVGLKSNADPDLEWALVRYGTNLKEQDAEASHWHGTLVRKNGPQSFNAGLHMSSKKGDIRLARYCLDNGADIESKNEHGQTSLHLAVLNGHEHLVLLLLERGADVETAMDNGAKPLYIAATQGRTQIAKLLLRAYADIESFNSKTQRTALCRAITNNHIEIVKLLLDGGVALNTLLSDGNTPLYIAARNNNAQIVELLLEYGADKTIQLRDGSTVEDHIKQGSSVAIVLRQPPILQGPPFNARRRLTPSITFPKPPRPPAPDQYDKLAACHGFEATIVDFYLDHYQDEERRIVETASIYDTLYERGPDRIMSAARGNRLQRQTAAFRWYHLPANNMDWIQALINKIATERRTAGTALLDEETKANLGLSNASGHAYHATTTNSSFMRPQCRSVEPKNQIMLFMPFLHYETLLGYDMMSIVVSQVKKTRAASLDPVHDREKPLWTGVLRRAISIETLERYHVDYEIDQDNPDLILIKRYLPRYESVILRKHTKRLRENRKRPTEKLDYSKVEDDFSSDFSEGEDLDYDKDESENTSTIRRTSRRGVSWSGAFAAAKQKLKRGAEQVISPRYHSPKKEKKRKSGADPTSNDIPDIEKHGRDPDLTVDETNNQRGRRGLRHAFHFPGLRRKEQEDLISEHEQPESDIKTTAKRQGPAFAIHGFDRRKRERSPLSTRPMRLNRGLRTRAESPPSFSSSRRQRLSSEESQMEEEEPLSTSTPSTTSRRGSSHSRGRSTFPKSSAARAGKVPSQRQARPLSVSADSGDMRTLDRRRSQSSISNDGKSSKSPSPSRPKARQGSSSPLDPLSKAVVLFDASLNQLNPSVSRRRSFSPAGYARPTDSSSFPSQQHARRRISEPDLLHPQPQSFENLDSPSLPQRRVFIAKDHNDSEKGSEAEMHDYGDFEASPRPIIPARLVSKKVLIDLGYPFQEEGDSIIIARQLEPELIHQILELSSIEMKRSATRHSSSRSGETDQGPSQGLPTQALALLNLPKQMHLSITDNLTTDLLNEHLIKGYLVPSEAKTIPPLQLRRTLDQYFYTHLKSTSQRDSDQVVYRYTKGAFQPKIFMVDQLWLWIFDDETIISCCPQQWDSAADQTFGFDNRTYRKRAPHDLPLDVRQSILKYLNKQDRDAITSVHQMAEVIINSCTNLFNTYQVSNEFQFLDFFERSIGTVIENESRCFQAFSRSLAASSNFSGIGSQSNNIFDITKETALLVEIKDIRDELSVLQMILNDQASVMKQFDYLATKAKGTLIASDKSVLDSHLYRIEKMDELAQKTYEALNHLLDLKQKQANASEARSARKQAEDTAVQAEQTTKQGKTVLVFTVVTIIFLPLSFMAAFFAINIDNFPFNASGKLPLGYVLKYLFSISIAVSIPFIFLAFNQEKLADMSKKISLLNPQTNKKWISSSWQNAFPLVPKRLVQPVPQGRISETALDARASEPLRTDITGSMRIEDRAEAIRRGTSSHRDETSIPSLRVVRSGRGHSEGRPQSAHPSSKRSAPQIPQRPSTPRAGIGHTNKSDIIPIPPHGQVHPLRDSSGEKKTDKWPPIPPDARWTKISRRLVNPEALEMGNEDFEAREDFVVVMRVLTRDEMQGYAEVTQRIRAAREELEEIEEREREAREEKS